MSESKYPSGWDAKRVKRLIDYYESMSGEEQAAEDEAALEEKQGQTVVTVPDELLPVIRQMLAVHNAG
jgi:hypothetical protein